MYLRRDHFRVRIYGSTIQDPAEVLADIAPNAAIGAIGPDQFEPAPAIVETPLVTIEERLQGQLAASAVLHPGTMDDHQQQKTQRIDHNMPLSAVGLLVHVHAARFSAFRRLHALTIDAGRAGLRLAAGLLARLFDQQRVDRFPLPSTRPTPKVAVHRSPRREVGGQHAPLAARAGHIQDGINNEPHLPLARSAPFAGRKVLFNLLPFGILQIGRVSLREFGHSTSLADL